MPTIRAGEGFTIQQILSNDGFTLDTGDFADTLDEEEELEYSKPTKLNGEEILKFLNLEEANENEENHEQDINIIGSSFDTIRSKMHSIYEDGGVMKYIQKEGVGQVVPNDAQVTVEYVGFFEYQDEPFDSTFYHKDKQIVLRLNGEMLKGLQIAISSMKKFEQSIFLIKPYLAYGELGCLPRVPPNSEVLFKISLLDFLDNGSANLYDELTNEEKKKFSVVIKIAKDLMNVAKNNFLKNNTKQSIREYSRAVTYLETAHLENDEEEKEMNKYLTRALTNLLVAYNKVGKYKLACASFQKLPSYSGKAYYQYGKALSNLGDYDESMKVLQKAFKLEPKNEDIRKEIQKVEQFRRKYADFSRQFAKKSLNIAKNKEENEFEKLAIEMCDAFIEDDVVKQEIPQGLSVEEIECIRRVAATKGLSITKQNRRDDETLFLTKKSFYSKNF